MKFLLHLLRRFTKVAYRIRGIGLGRVCECIRTRVAKVVNCEPFLIDDFQGHGKFRCFLREHMGSQIFFRGAYSVDSLKVLSSHLTPNSVFIDVGANHGEFTIAAALVATGGHIVAFEPLPRNIDRLRTNVRLNNFSNVQIVPTGLADQSGSFPVYDQDSIYSDGTTNEGLASLFPVEGSVKSHNSISVQRLDDAWPSLGLDRVDIIKLDIEGAEWSALLGGQQLLARYKPVLLVEIGRSTCTAAGYKAEDFAQWIVEQGYRLFKIKDGGQQQEVSAMQMGDFQNLLALPQL